MLAKLSSIYENLRGRSGSVVLFPIASRQFVRSWVQPANPQSDMQDKVRAAMSAASLAFSSISDNERAGWTSFAQSAKKKDKNGTEYVMPDKGAYISVNFLRSLFGQSIVDTAPTFVSEAAATSVDAVTYGGSTLHLDFTAQGNKKYIVYLSNGITSAQDNKPAVKLPNQNPSSCIVTTDGDGAGTLNLTDSSSNLTNIAAGKYIKVKIVALSADYVEGGVIEDKLLIAAA